MYTKKFIPTEQNNVITIPQEWYDKMWVEMNVFPVEPKQQKQWQIKSDVATPPTTKLQDWILQAPTWLDQEYNNYLEARTHFNQLGQQ